MHRSSLLPALFLIGSQATAAARSETPAPAVAAAAFPLTVSSDRRYLVDQKDRPFFVMGDTPWFIQKVPIEDVRLVMDDRKTKGYNTLFLAILDDNGMPSRDAYGNLSFNPETDITRPVEAYWRHADQVMVEAQRRGFFVIMAAMWYGAGKGWWLHHVKPASARTYGRFLGKRYARFRHLMWMHGGDHNPDDNLLASTRALAEGIRTEAPHHLHTVHNQAEFASAAFHHADRWLDVNLGYTYGAAHLHILPEYERKDPVRPIILGETGYEGGPHAERLLPDGLTKDELWTPYLVRRNAWWAVLSGASGFCNGTTLWMWGPTRPGDMIASSKSWREVLDVASTRQTPLILKLFEKVPWWRFVPDTKHEFVTAGFGERKKVDHAAAALAGDGSVGVVYLPTARTLTVDLSKLRGPAAARWFDPTSGAWRPVDGMGTARTRRGPREFTPPAKNAAGEADWVLVLESRPRRGEAHQ